MCLTKYKVGVLFICKPWIWPDFESITVVHTLKIKYDILSLDVC